VTFTVDTILYIGCEKTRATWIGHGFLKKYKGTFSVCVLEIAVEGGIIAGQL